LALLSRCCDSVLIGLMEPIGLEGTISGSTTCAYYRVPGHSTKWTYSARAGLSASLVLTGSNG
jgi:hypothetical protein